MPGAEPSPGQVDGSVCDLLADAHHGDLEAACVFDHGKFQIYRRDGLAMEMAIDLAGYGGGAATTSIEPHSELKASTTRPEWLRSAG